MTLTDEQKIVIHLCMQAEKSGHDNAWIARDDLLEGRCTPREAAGTFVLLRLMWAALAMPNGILEWSANGQAFRMSEEAIEHVLASAAARRATTSIEAREHE